MFIIPCFKNSSSLYVKLLCTCTHVNIALDIDRNKLADKNLSLSSGNTVMFLHFACSLSLPKLPTMKMSNFCSIENTVFFIMKVFFSFNLVFASYFQIRFYCFYFKVFHVAYFCRFQIPILHLKTELLVTWMA